MRNDLINRNDLLNEIESIEWWNVPETKVINKLKDIIERQKVAYNVDEVVKQLEMKARGEWGYPSVMEFDDVVHIVKAGEMDE